MANRRINANNLLAPAQEVAVNPFHSYDSNHVNMLTRMVTGNRDKDVVVDGLQVYGIPENSSEILGTVLINEDFDTDPFTNPNWNHIYYFTYDSVNKRIVATTPAAGTRFFEALYTTTSHLEPVSSSSAMTPVPKPEAFAYYKIELSLRNFAKNESDIIVENKGTPLYMYVSYGGNTQTYSYPAQADYSFYIQAETDETFSVVLVMDGGNSFMPVYSTIDNIRVTQVLRRGGDILPIIDQTVSQDCIHSVWLRPHTSCKVTSGVAIKDDVMLNMLGVDPQGQPVSTLVYGSDDYWIGGILHNGTTAPKAFTNSDFAWPTKVTDIPVLDDADPNHKYYCDYPTGPENDYKWAYICIYYAYYKNPVPNTAYIGLAREEEINDPVYSEDYLPLAKVRFISKDVVDAIFYNPVRVDWGLIDASKVSYLLMENLEHWETRPRNVSIALDILAARIFDMIKFQVNWSDGNTLNPMVSDGEWPVLLSPESKPDNWLWYSRTSDQYSARSDNPGDKTTVYSPAYLSSTTYKSIEDAIAEWPKNYYVVVSSDPEGSVAVINPTNIYGAGKVPGPKSDDVTSDRFLRADGKWRKTIPTATIVMYAGPLPTNIYDEVEGGGWLLCLGQQFPKLTYPDLAEKLSSHSTYFPQPGLNFTLPDMSDRFVIGYKPLSDPAPNPRDDIPLGQIGGNHLIQLNEDNLPSHRHPGLASLSGSSATTGYTSHTHGYRYYKYTFESLTATHYGSANIKTLLAVSHENETPNALTSSESGSTDGHNHTISIGSTVINISTDLVGAGQEIDIRPKWISLGYIIKT